jgi:hypothetical protein
MRKTRSVREPKRTLDLETDNPDLADELLKAANGPFTPYSSDEMRVIGKRIIDHTQNEEE